jgi:signal transduction histidine kinase
VVAIEYRVRHTDGRYVWLASKETALVRDRAGRAERIVGCATDLTDQRQALAEKKKISKQLLRTQDEERRRIARELHDSTAQHLVAAGIGLTRLHLIGERESDARMDRADVQEILRDVRRGITEVQREIRALSYLLHPPALERVRLGRTLRRFATGFARRTRIRVDLAIQDGPAHARIEDDGKGGERASPAGVDGMETMGVGIPGMRARPAIPARAGSPLWSKRRPRTRRDPRTGVNSRLILHCTGRSTSGGDSAAIRRIPRIGRILCGEPVSTPIKPGAGFRRNASGLDQLVANRITDQFGS